MKIEVYFWHKRSAPHARDLFDPSHGEDFEYIPLDAWSRAGWSPSLVDLTVPIESIPEMRRESADFRVIVSAKVGVFEVDGATSLLNASRLSESSRWIPAIAVERVEGKPPVRGQRVVVVEGFQIGRLCDELWRRGLWPVQLRFEMVPNVLDREAIESPAVAGMLDVAPSD